MSGIRVVFTPQAQADLVRLEEFLWQAQDPLTDGLLDFLLDGLGVGELGERLSLDSGTLTPLLRRLEEAGLLERRRSRDDERRVTVVLSTAGQALKARAGEIPRQIAASTGCSLDELAALRGQLARLRAALLQSPPGP